MAQWHNGTPMHLHSQPHGNTHKHRSTWNVIGIFVRRCAGLTEFFHWTKLLWKSADCFGTPSSSCIHELHQGSTSCCDWVWLVWPNQPHKVQEKQIKDCTAVPLAACLIGWLTEDQPATWTNTQTHTSTQTHTNTHTHKHAHNASSLRPAYFV